MVSTSQTAPKRTILYYPTISIPTGAWLRQALLYWDQVSSIVPQSIKDGSSLTPFSPDIDYLQSEGEFRAITPEQLLMQDDSYPIVKKFEADFKDIIDSDLFQRALGSSDLQLTSLVHQNKVSHEIYGYLAQKGLVLPVSNLGSEWYTLDTRAALLYMSLLAQYLADIDLDATVPGTDNIEYEQFVFAAATDQTGFPCLDTRFGSALPIPREDVSLSDLIQFKRKRRDELLQFRTLIDEFQKDLSLSPDVREVKATLVRCKERIEYGISDLRRVLSDSRVATVAGTLKTIINVKSSTLIAALAVATGHAKKMAETPVEWVVAGLTVSGIVQVGYHLVQKRNERRAALRTSPFAYLYHASDEGLILKD